MRRLLEAHSAYRASAYRRFHAGGKISSKKIGWACDKGFDLIAAVAGQSAERQNRPLPAVPVAVRAPSTAPRSSGRHSAIASLLALRKQASFHESFSGQFNARAVPVDAEHPCRAVKGR